jgi:hypothetical protein
MKPQTARVLAVLRRRPVTLADFDCQPACDGGDRITRLGARIQDLKDDGYPIASKRLGHMARYTLLTGPISQASPALTPPAGDKPASPPPAARAETSKMPRSSGEARPTVGVAVDPCEAMVAPAARDSSASAHGALFDIDAYTQVAA